MKSTLYKNGERFTLNELVNSVISKNRGKRGRRRYSTIKVNGKRISKHRYKVEKVLWHPLPPGVEVHHVDGNPRNNRKTNLVVCQDKEYHELIHQRTIEYNRKQIIAEINARQPIQSNAYRNVPSRRGDASFDPLSFLGRGE